MEQNNLMEKYSDEESKKELSSEYNKKGLWKFFGGIALIVTGIIISISSEQFIFYGIVWVGMDFLLLGIISLFFKKSEDELSKGTKILLWIISLALTILILIASGFEEFNL